MIQSAVARMRTSLYRPNEPPTRQENWKVGVSHYQWYGHCQGSALTVSVPVRHCSHFCERARVVPMMEGRITRPMVKFLRLLSGFLASWHVWARRGAYGSRTEPMASRDNFVRWSQSEVAARGMSPRVERWKIPLSRTCVTESIDTHPRRRTLNERQSHPNRGQWRTVSSSAATAKRYCVPRMTEWYPQAHFVGQVDFLQVR
jgi:hypothetical protein